MADAIFYVLRTGIQRKALPRELVSGSSAYGKYPSERSCAACSAVRGVARRVAAARRPLGRSLKPGAAAGRMGPSV